MDKVNKLKTILQEMGSVLIAYSGGVDSAYLAFVANSVLGKKALAVFTNSPVATSFDLERASTLAGKIGLNFRTIEVNPLANPRFVSNDPERCYYCKRDLFQILKTLAVSEDLKWLADGSICDDLDDYRPGSKACQEMNVRSPLLEASINKAEIRGLSRIAGLPGWDRPSSPCLASRIPYGIPVTSGVLNKIAEGEKYLHSLGLKQLRLRHHGDVARIELESEDMPVIMAPGIRGKLVEKIRSLGYQYITLDLSGYRTGSLNEKLNMTKDNI